MQAQSSVSGPGRRHGPRRRQTGDGRCWAPGPRRKRNTKLGGWAGAKLGLGGPQWTKVKWSLVEARGGTGAWNIPEQAVVAARQRLGLGIYFFISSSWLGWRGKTSRSGSDDFL